MQQILISQLLKAVEKTAGQPIDSPSSFEWLSVSIFEMTHQMLSVATIKRIFGYTNPVCARSVKTLNILSQYVGYKDWKSFCKQFTDNLTTPQSNPIKADKIETKNLRPGQRLRVIWEPDRACVFRYEDKGRFVVEVAENSKLCVGDTFECALFINNEPLYLTHLRTSRSEDEDLTYVCGRDSGVTIMKM